MTGSYLLHNELHYNGLMPDLSLSVKSSLQSHESKWKEDIYYIIRLKTFVIVNHIFRIFILSIVALASLSACRDYDFDDSNNNKSIQHSNKSTHFSFAFSVAGAKAQVAPSTRSNSHSGDHTDISYWGKWGGNDSIASVTIYLFHRATGSTEDYTYEETKTFPAAELQTVLQTDHQGGRVLFRPRKAIASTPGEKRIFVVVNPTTSISKRIEKEIVDNGGIGTYRFKSFDDFLHGPDVVEFQTSNYPDAPTTTTRADELVQRLGNKDAILMSGESVSFNIPDNVAEGDAWDNVPEAVVERAVARVVVSFNKSVKEDSFLNGDEHGNTSEDVASFGWDQYKGKVIYDNNNNLLGYISEVSWTVVQGGSRLNFLKKEGKSVEFNYRYGLFPKIEDGEIKRNAEGEIEYDPHYHPRQITTEQTPAGDVSLTYRKDFWSDLSEYTAIKDKFDYSALWKPYHTMRYRDDNFDTTGDSVKELSHVITDDAPCEYVLPTQLNDQLGTSAYVLVKAKIHPLSFYDEDGILVDPNSGQPYPEDKEIYFNPIVEKFYVDPDNDQDQTGKYEYFKEGWCYYMFPLNTDGGSEQGWSSHVNRNAYYHIQIAGFANIGIGWNPLVPYPERATANYATKKFPENPHNPAPFPTNNPNLDWEFEVPLYLPSSYIEEELKRDDENNYASDTRQQLKEKEIENEDGTKRKELEKLEDKWSDNHRAFHGLLPKPKNPKPTTRGTTRKLNQFKLK